MKSKISAIVLGVGSLFGLIFALISTFDFTAHLDRQIHSLHCSFIPGASVSDDAANGCKAALFSSYSSLFRESYWGGIPISLFAIGAFTFFLGFAVYLLLAGDKVPRAARLFHGTIGFSPLFVSIVMFTISLLELGTFCKVCVGIYVSSIVIGVSALLAWRQRGSAEDPSTAATKPYPDAEGAPPVAKPRIAGPLLVPAWLLALGASSLLPAVVYAGTMPDYTPYLSRCGKLEVPKEAHGALLKVPTKNPMRAVTLFEDPLCPSCKAFHERLIADGIYERFDVTLALFPLDGTCNWMVPEPPAPSPHPGACVLAKAVLCGGNGKARDVLEWSYANQDELRVLGKVDEKGVKLKERIAARFGHELATCVDDPKTAQKLTQHLHFAANNHIPVSTPQVFIGDQKLCDEDTDLGLRYALSRMAKEVLP